jgi:hypothetical protein
MKIFRGGALSDSWQNTDSAKASQVAKDWADDGVVRFDGTIDKSGLRHTALGIEIEDGDIVALVNALLTRLRRKNRELTVRLNEALKESIDLKDGLEKIDNLMTFHERKAPSPEALISAVQQIVNHYRIGEYRRKPPPYLNWVKWGEL